MCKKSPDNCKAKIKCQRCSYAVKQSFIPLVDKSCEEKLVIEQEDDKLNLTELDSQFEHQYYVIDVKGD